ncbi:MAG: hypothetical protein H6Q72_2738 [Firmicutes bacterium]|nr:hypothetical protein [Bacillota bacterium]
MDLIIRSGNCKPTDFPRKLLKYNEANDLFGLTSSQFGNSMNGDLQKSEVTIGLLRFRNHPIVVFTALLTVYTVYTSLAAIFK